MSDVNGWITAEDVSAVYAKLKEHYELLLTNTYAVDDGFMVDAPILVGKAHGFELWLYEDGGEFILDVLDASHTRGTHWHPENVESAAADVVAFMEGRLSEGLQRLPRLRTRI